MDVPFFCSYCRKLITREQAAIIINKSGEDELVHTKCHTERKITDARKHGTLGMRVGGIPTKTRKRKDGTIEILGLDVFHIAVVDLEEEDEE